MRVQAQSKPLRLYLCLFRKLELVGGGPLGAHLHMVLQTCHAKGVGVRKRAANDRGPSIGILRRQNTNLYALETRCHRHRVDFSKKGTRKAAVCAASEDGLKLWNAPQLLNLRLECPVWCKISKVYETRMAKYRSSLAQTSIPWCRRWRFCAFTADASCSRNSPFPVHRIDDQHTLLGLCRTGSYGRRRCGVRLCLVGRRRPRPAQVLGGDGSAGIGVARRPRRRSWRNRLEEKRKDES